MQLKEMNNKIFWSGILILIFLRMFMVLAVMLNYTSVPFFMDYFSVNGQEASHGDKTVYFRLAKEIINSDIKQVSYRTPIGTPLYLVPYVWLWDAGNDKTHFAITRPTFLVNTFLFYFISIIIVCLIGREIFKKRIYGLALGVLYVFSPWIFYFLDLSPYQNHSFFINLMWLVSGLLTDSPSALLMYIVFYYALKFIKNEKLKMRDYVFYGFFWGLACLLRESNAIFVFATAYLMLRKINIKGIMISASVFILVYTPQFIYNHFAHGSFLSNGKNALGSPWAGYHLFEKGTIAQDGITPENYLYLLFLWIMPFTALYAAFNTGARAIRYWLPIIPQALIIMIFGFWLIFNIKKLIMKDDKK